MVNPINDIVKQAHQGSVAAIIQILNEKLAASGVRTRAIFADGVLQLLCEAAKVDQLEKSVLVENIRQTLESIAPRNIRRVNINSRIVREQQLLWLDEINRNPESQLLWSEEIALAQPNLLRQLTRQLKARQIEEPRKPSLPRSTSSHRVLREKPSSRRGLVGGVSILSLLIVGWLIYAWLGGKLQNPLQAQTPKLTELNTNQKTAAAPSTADTKTVAAQATDSFAAAVRVANQAAEYSRIAESSVQWLDLAAKWQRASDLMSLVPSNHTRYQEAQIRTKLYRKYSEAAQQEAQKKSS